MRNAYDFKTFVFVKHADIRSFWLFKMSILLPSANLSFQLWEAWVKNSLFRAELLSLAVPSGPTYNNNGALALRSTGVTPPTAAPTVTLPTCRSTSGRSWSSCCWECAGKAEKVLTLIRALMLVFTRMEPGVSKSTSTPPRFLFMGPTTAANKQRFRGETITQIYTSVITAENTPINHGGDRQSGKTRQDLTTKHIFRSLVCFYAFKGNIFISRHFGWKY